MTSELPSVFDDGDAYDLVLSDIPYGRDFYVNLAVKASGPVLDVACGTGRILLAAMEQGVDIEGVDLFEPMLRRLRWKANERQLAPKLHQADMSEFFIDRKFGLIMIPFNAFIHNMTLAAQLACLNRCREQLLPGGRLVFDTFFPSVEIIGAKTPERVLEGEFLHPATGQTIRMFDTRTFDRVQQTQHSVNELEILDSKGQVERVIRSQTKLRYIYKHEMELLLRLTHWDRWEIWSDFEGSELVDENSAMVVSAWNGA